jgi:hypothetical protein
MTEKDKKDKKINVVFDPGCFDGFEGTQEELDELVKEITETMSNMTHEELMESAIELDDQEINELLDEFVQRGQNSRLLN